MMTEILFPDFLTDPQQYKDSEALWHQRWRELVQGVGQTHAWESPWYATTFAGGTPCRDGNPIFSAADPKRKLGIRVIQYEPVGQRGEITFWLNRFAKGQPEEIKELVISCSLTHYTLSMALDFMCQWITRESIRLAHESPDDPFWPEMDFSASTALARVA
jgi:hypothetical protein